MAIAKTKKKKWYKIIAPPLFEGQEIGETFIEEPKNTIGRTIALNLMVLTNDPKKQNINVGFRITSVEGESLKTEIYNYILTPSSIKRFVRRERDRIDDSFDCITSDNKVIKIKPLLITRFKTNNSVLSSLRLATRKFLYGAALKTAFNELMKDAISHRLQNQLKASIKKIYDVKTCEIRSLEYVREGQPGERIEKPIAAEGSIGGSIDVEEELPEKDAIVQEEEKAAAKKPEDKTGGKESRQDIEDIEEEPAKKEEEKGRAAKAKKQDRQKSQEKTEKPEKSVVMADAEAGD